MIAGLRALGLAARYVSGYIRTYSDPERSNLRGVYGMANAAAPV